MHMSTRERSTEERRDDWHGEGFSCYFSIKIFFKLCTEMKHMKHEIRVGLSDLRCIYNWEEWFSALSLPLISVGPQHLCEIPRGKV